MGVERRPESGPTQYRPRRPSQTVCYRCVQEHLATWLAQIRDGHEDDRLVSTYVERALRRYPEFSAGGSASVEVGHSFPAAL